MDTDTLRKWRDINKSNIPNITREVKKSCFWSAASRHAVSLDRWSNVLSVRRPQHRPQTFPNLMSHLPLMLHDIPESCPIPRGVVVHIGGYVGERPMFALWRDRKQIIIEAPHMIHRNSFKSEWDVMCEERKMYANYLEIIVSSLSVNFSRPRLIGPQCLSNLTYSPLTSISQTGVI